MGGGIAAVAWHYDYKHDFSAAVAKATFTFVGTYF